MNEATKNNNELIKEYKAQNLKNNTEIVFPSSEQNRSKLITDLFATASNKFICNDKTSAQPSMPGYNLMPTNYLMHLGGCSKQSQQKHVLNGIT